MPSPLRPACELGRVAPLCLSIRIRSRDYDSSTGPWLLQQREREAPWSGRRRTYSSLDKLQSERGDHGITQQKFAIEPTVERRASR
jgi:hypothetical protein